MKNLFIAVLLWAITDNVSFANPALDIRFERGWQAYVKTGKLKLTTTNKDKSLKKHLEKWREETDKKLNQADSIWGISVATIHFYPHQPVPLALGLRFTSIPDRINKHGIDAEHQMNINVPNKEISLGVQIGNPRRKGLYGGGYITLYDEFGFATFTEEEEEHESTKTVKTDYNWDTIRVDGDIGLRAPIVGRIFGQIGVAAGFYRATYTINRKTTEEKESEEESRSAQVNYMTFSFIAGVGFLIGDASKVKKEKPTRIPDTRPTPSKLQ